MEMEAKIRSAMIACTCSYIFNDYSFVFFTSSLTLDTLYRVCDSMHRFYDFIWQLD